MEKLNELQLFEAHEKGILLREAIKIINELAENNIADEDNEYDETLDNVLSPLKKLILKSRTLKNARWWDLLFKI